MITLLGLHCPTFSDNSCFGFGSGHILLCIPPTGTEDAIRAVKWYPKDQDVLAIASDKNIYIIDLANTHALHGQPLPHSDLHHIGQIFNVPSVSCHYHNLIQNIDDHFIDYCRF